MMSAYQQENYSQDWGSWHAPLAGGEAASAVGASPCRACVRGKGEASGLWAEA